VVSKFLFQQQQQQQQPQHLNINTQINAMINIVLSRNIRHLRTPIISSRLSYQSARAASIYSGIARGLRKSKGVGFRGRDFEKKDHGPNFKSGGFKGRESDSKFEKKGFSPRDKPIERNDRTSEQRGFTNRPQMSREGWPGKSSMQPPERSQETRIYKGDKPVKTDLQLARKKPNPAGSSQNRGYVSGAQFVDRALSQSQPSHFQRPGYGERLSENPQRGSRAKDSSSEGWSRKGFSNASSYETRDESGLKNKYPSLSFGKPKFPKQQAESDLTKRLPDRQRQLYSSGRDPEQERDSKPRQRQSYFEERSFERRSKALGNAHPLRNSAMGFTANAAREKDYDHKMDSGKSDEHPRRPRFTNTIDSQIPLSITYTTPASEFLYGTSVVEAALRSTRIPRRQHYKFYICAGENRENTQKDAEMERLAKSKQVKIVKLSGEGLRLMEKMSAGRPHNGYILEASPLPRLPITKLCELTTKDNQFGFEVGVDHQSREEAAINGTSNFVRIPRTRGDRKPLILLLDRIVDPGNLGGIIRTASFLGVSAVAISAQGSASFSPVVLKASTGASEDIPIFSVNDPTSFAQDSKQAGWKVYAAVSPRPSTESFRPVSSMSTEDLVDPLEQDPCILMVGGEGDGLPKYLRSKADVEIHIPARGGNHIVDSLNVSVATGILCNAFLSQSTVEREQTEDRGDAQDPSSDRLF